MKITIACVGKIKEKYLTAGIEEFTKRLQPFCKLETIAIGCRMRRKRLIRPTKLKRM